MTADRDENPDSQLLQCVECGEFYPARDDTDELVPVDGAAGGRCLKCGNDESERVVLDPNRKHD